MSSLEIQSFASPDASRQFRHRGRIQIVTMAGADIAQATFEPGWHWATDIKPEVGTPSCQEEHTGYILCGRLRVQYDDGQSLDLERGHVFHLPARRWLPPWPSGRARSMAPSSRHCLNPGVPDVRAAPEAGARCAPPTLPGALDRTPRRSRR